LKKLAAIVYAYSDAAVTLGTQDLIGAVFGAAPEKYNTVLNVTSDIKGKYLDIDDLETVMYMMNWSWGHLQALAVYARIKAKMPLTAHARLVEVVVVEATKIM
jgi:hypothetical protein